MPNDDSKSTYDAVGLIATKAKSALHRINEGMQLEVEELELFGLISKDILGLRPEIVWARNGFKGESPPLTSRKALIFSVPFEGDAETAGFLDWLDQMALDFDTLSQGISPSPERSQEIESYLEKLISVCMNRGGSPCEIVHR